MSDRVTDWLLKYQMRVIGGFLAVFMVIDLLQGDWFRALALAPLVMMLWVTNAMVSYAFRTGWRAGAEAVGYQLHEELFDWNDRARWWLAPPGVFRHSWSTSGGWRTWSRSWP